MNTVIAYLVAFTSTVAFLVLWFGVVHRELKAKRNTVISAQLQLAACRKKYVKAKGNSEKQVTQATLSRSEDIYSQSVMLYNQTFFRLQNYIPGFLMGFRQIEEGKGI